MPPWCIHEHYHPSTLYQRDSSGGWIHPHRQDRRGGRADPQVLWRVRGYILNGQTDPYRMHARARRLTTLRCCNCHHHRPATAPTIEPAEGDPSITATFDLPAGSCAELLLPPAFPLLQVFADGGARIGFALNATSFAVKANGGGVVYSDDALELDYLYAFSDGYVYIVAKVVQQHTGHLLQAGPHQPDQL